MSAKSSIQVCIKVRPCEPELPSLWQVKDKRTIQPVDSLADPCVFDYVYDQGSNNQEVFDGMAKHIVEACVKGFNGTIFAYGQTSSGKTYTMMGDRQNPGVMVLAAKEIFNQISNQTDRDFLLRVGYIEIYNEKICDLLNKKNVDLKIYESNGMVNVNCEECIITSEEDLLQFLCLGNKERTVGETNMNERSSRSHAIFRIIIESRKTDRSEDDAVIQSILNLVDLAGSERADQTGARGTRFKEGSHINKSLLFLSNVIKSLAESEDNRYVNYRDSKLTRILQASLGGNAFTSIICTIRPSIMDESQSTINFAMRAKKIRLKPQLNEIVSDATMMKRLEREIKSLKDRLAMEQAKNESQIKVRLLEERIKSGTLKIITSNTVTDNRNKIRRRTWCPTSSNPNVTSTREISVPVTNGSNGPNININHSNLPKPNFYPTTSHPNYRTALGGAKTINIMKSLEVKDEPIPVVEPNFEQATNPNATNKSRLRIITLTPTMAQLGAKGREMLEREVVELEAFTKIEQKINSEWDDLNEKLAAATAQIDKLQAERLNLLQRSEDLQVEVDTLRKSKEESDTRIANYEEQLKTLKETVARLDMENRAAVELEFQFTSLKSKAKLRENELLSTLSEKDCAIDNLQKSLNELSNEVLRNSKDDHMRSICPALETSCELICKKCADLEQRLEEYNNNPNCENGARFIDCECEQLRADISSMRAQLESVQQSARDAAEKSEQCDRLSREVVSAEEAKIVLQEKFDDLEQAQQRAEETVKAMQAEYDAIQKKYHTLQQDYERLEHTSTSSEELRQKLQSENDSLQQEIGTLKQSVEEMQIKLLEATVSDAHESLVQQLTASNAQLMENLAQMETKYGDLQSEYDDLSNQLMESVQDGDSLREEFNSLKEQRDADRHQLHDHIAQLEREVDEKNQLMEATECTINEMREQMQNLQSELLEKSVIVNKVEDYQRQIESLEKQHAEMTMVCEELQDKVKETTINESLSRSTSTVIAPDSGEEKEQEINTLRERLIQLNGELAELQTDINKQLTLVRQKDELIKELKLELQELNERCLSMDVLQVELRSNAEQQQQLLDLQAAKLADDASRIDQLQESNAKLTERSIKAEDALEERLSLATEVDVIKAEYERRLQQLQTTLNNAREEFDQLDKLNKDELKNVQLEFLDKIEVSESRYRENLHKYNAEWEDRLNKLTADGEGELLAVKAAMALEKDQLINEKRELESLYNECKETVLQLQDKLNSKEQEEAKANSEKHSELVTHSTEKLRELEEKCEKQLQDYEQLKLEHQQEKSSLQSIVDENKLTIEQLTLQLNSEKEMRESEASQVIQLSLALEEGFRDHTKAEAEYRERMETYNCKISDLQEEIRQANQLAKDLKQLVAEHDELEAILAKTAEYNKLLVEKSEELERDLLLTQTEVVTQKSKVESLQSKLSSTQEVITNVSSIEASFTQRIHELENEMSEQAQKFNRKIEDLVSSNAELNIKMEALVKRKVELEALNHDLTVKLKNELNLQELLSEQREHNLNFQETNAQLQSELQAKQEECDTLQRSLQHSEAESHALQQSLEQAESQLKIRQEECSTLKKALQQAMCGLNEKQEELDALQKSSNEEEQQLQSQLKAKLVDCDKLQESLQQTESNLNVKQTACDTLQQSLQEAKSQLQALQQSLQEAESLSKLKQVDCESLQQALQQAEAELASNETAVRTLQTSLQQAESQLQIHQRECENLKQSLQLKESLLQTIPELELQLRAKQTECDTLLKSLQQAESQLQIHQRECENLKQSLQLKESLLPQLELQLRAKQTECETLLKSLQQVELQLLEVNKKHNESVGRVKSLQIETEKIRCMQKANKVNFDAERERLDATVLSLLDDKRNLEEKLCITNDIVQKLEAELKTKSSCSNVSFDSNTSNVSPASKKSSDRDPHQQHQKSLNIESELRRHRRMSTHDERRQSYWSDSRNVACMTDPVDKNCSCAELDRKLKECQFELFVSDSKVTALNIELKNHPLKDENAQLKKRLQDDQQKSREEIKRIKNKNLDLMSKINASAANSPAPPPAIAKPKLANVETQTESQLEMELKKTTDKLNDCVQICRHRYNHIKGLEERLKDYENSDTSNISSQTSGQIHVLKTQLENAKKEIATLANKYEYAKKALKLRKDEIDELRQGAGTVVTASSK